MLAEKGGKPTGYEDGKGGSAYAVLSILHHHLIDDARLQSLKLKILQFAPIALLGVPFADRLLRVSGGVVDGPLVLKQAGLIMQSKMTTYRIL